MLAGSVAFAALAAGRDLRAQPGQSPLGQSQALAPAAKPPSFRLEEAAHFAHQVTGVAVSADGRIFVCDRENDRVQVFDQNGKLTIDGCRKRSSPFEVVRLEYGSAIRGTVR